MRGHVDAESLALYAEGELSRGRTARVRAHLPGCPECAATLAALGEVTTQLSHVPAAPMPSAVTARLDAALGAEAAHRAAAPSAPVPAPAGASHRRPPRRNPRWSPAGLRILAGTAVTLVVAGGVGYAVSQFAGSGASSTASAPAGPSGHHPNAQAQPNISAGATGGHAKKPHAGPYIPASITRWAQTGTDYRPGTLGQQGQQLLAEYDTPGISGPSQVPAGSIPAAVRNCVAQTAHGRVPAVVDLARYQQHPAIVIVLGKPADTVTAVSRRSCLSLHSARLSG
jgi:anti-sigma factor RsiW